MLDAMRPERAKNILERLSDPTDTPVLDVGERVRLALLHEHITIWPRITITNRELH